LTTSKHHPAAISNKRINHEFIDRNTRQIFICRRQRGGTPNEGGVWRSSDHGKTWQRIFKAFYVWQAQTSPVNPKLIVISAPGQRIQVEHPFMNPGVYLSQDAGNTWRKINHGLGQPDKIVDIKPDPFNENVLWCASWGCGWFVAYLDEATQTWMSQ
jgi:hypothetical protein